MTWIIPLSHCNHPDLELQVPDEELSAELLHKVLPVALKLQEAFVAADRFQRGLAPFPKSFAHDSFKLASGFVRLTGTALQLPIRSGIAAHLLRCGTIKTVRWG